MKKLKIDSKLIEELNAKGIVICTYETNDGELFDGIDVEFKELYDFEEIEIKQDIL